MFALQKVPLLKISDDVIACDLWFGTPQSKILATPMTAGHTFNTQKEQPNSDVIFKQQLKQSALKLNIDNQFLPLYFFNA